MTVILNKH